MCEKDNRIMELEALLENERKKRIKTEEDLLNKNTYIFVWETRFGIVSASAKTFEDGMELFKGNFKKIYPQKEKIYTSHI